MGHRRLYTKAELKTAFYDGIAVGIAFEDGTFGGPDFMNEAWDKRNSFLKESKDDFPHWEHLWSYCGGNTLHDDEPYDAEPEAETPTPRGEGPAGLKRKPSIIN